MYIYIYIHRCACTCVCVSYICISCSKNHQSSDHQDELWKLEGPSAEEIQAAKAAAQKVPGTAAMEPLGAWAQPWWASGPAIPVEKDGKTPKKLGKTGSEIINP